MSDQTSSSRVSWSSTVNSKREHRNLDKVDRKSDDKRSYKHGEDGSAKRKRSPDREYSSSRSKKISRDARIERSHEHPRGEVRSSRRNDRDEGEKSSKHGENGSSKRKRSPERDHSSSRSKKISKDSRMERSHEHSRSKGRSSKRSDRGEDEKDPYEGLTEEEKMAKMMGFSTFDTTKGKPVTGNNIGAVHIVHKRKYRQYMNRKGGFNRPLDFVA